MDLNVLEFRTVHEAIAESSSSAKRKRTALDRCGSLADANGQDD